MTTQTEPAQDTWREFSVAKPEGVEFIGDPVGALEMSARLGVQDRSIHMMRRRGQLPKPDYDAINGSRAWEWSTVLWWAGETDRLRTDDLRAAYKAMFNCTPLANPGNRTAPGVLMREDEHPDLPTVPSRPRSTDLDAVASNGKRKR